MVILHAFLALAAGFATMALLVIVLTALLTRMVPAGRARRVSAAGVAFVNLATRFWLRQPALHDSWAAAAIVYHVLALGIWCWRCGTERAANAGKAAGLVSLALVAISPLGVLPEGWFGLRVWEYCSSATCIICSTGA